MLHGAAGAGGEAATAAAAAMGRRSLNYRYIKTLRVASWCLLVLMLLYLLSGYTMTGRFHLGRWMRAETALKIHKALHYPLAAVLVAHAVPGVYFAWRRWHKKRSRRLKR